VLGEDMSSDRSPCRHYVYGREERGSCGEGAVGLVLTRLARQAAQPAGPRSRVDAQAPAQWSR